jgi:hypothetical protein
MHLHMFMAKEYMGVAHQLPNVVEYLKECSVAEEYKEEKAQLIGYAEELFTQAKILMREH